MSDCVRVKERERVSDCVRVRESVCATSTVGPEACRGPPMVSE